MFIKGDDPSGDKRAGSSISFRGGAGSQVSAAVLETRQPILRAHEPPELIQACFKVKVGVGHLCSEKRKFPVFLRCGRPSFIQKMAWVERKKYTERAGAHAFERRKQ